MDLSAPADDELNRLVVDALAASEPEPVPPPLRQRVLNAARAMRPAGRPQGTTSLSPVEGYRRTVHELDDVLAGCDAADWVALVDPYGWTVQGLVGHLLAIERLLGARLGVDVFEVPAELESDHLAVTHELVDAQGGRDPAATLAEWRSAFRRVLDAVAAVPDLDQRVSMHGLDFRWRALLVVRTLEVWTHTDDIRRATGRPVAAPDAERLALMTDLAVRTLPARLAATGGPPEQGGVVRIVLTGPGGGVWQQPFGRGEATDEPQVRIVADAVGFCRLTAGRITTAALAATIDGDQRLGASVLTASAAFAV
jgi:uncharacterized protein (TIGR03083 family)